MTTNRIRDLREAKGLSQDELGVRVGTNKFKISRIENEETRLDLELAQRIAKALDVSLADVLGLDGPRGFSQDAAPYDAGPHDPLYRLADSAKGRALYVVRSNALDELGVTPGVVLQIDMTPAAVENVAPLSLVVAQQYSDIELLDAVTLLRQFVPPSMLVTNSRQHNMPAINLATSDVHIKGVVLSWHHKPRTGLQS